MASSDQLATLSRGAAKIISEDELTRKLNKGRPLRVKLGVDPTSPDLHLGHTLLLRKLRAFQDCGHVAVLIIGDFTALIGDPSGRSATRPQISSDLIEANAKTYRDQAFKILDESRTEVVYNSAWLGRLSFADILRLNSRVTLQQLLHRDDFRGRWEKQQPIHAHEIQYPIMQGWDSVMIKADVELGGTDQLFNILMGREMQRSEGQEDQVAMVLPILEGLDGVKKMSKSLGNCVALNDAPGEMFGKLMSISDELMGKYYSLLLERTTPAENPFEAKKQLAFEIVQQFHSRAAALQQRDEWIARFSKRELTKAELPEFWPFAEVYGDDAVSVVAGAFSFCFDITKSRTEIRALMSQGSVRLDGQKLSDPKAKVNLASGQILRLDKTHAVRIA